ncbi:cupin domain-containing protein [Phenylobacterium sp. LjRoot225]|uniref:cupin domain-containing protein n=1 Tax=Phenylobacterium sp. LjRoot225 TaxID=3342285 RepID=UPI003ECEB6D6
MVSQATAARVRGASVFDLRLWAAEQAQLQAGDAWPGGQQALPLGDDRISVGVAQLTAGGGERGAAPFDEFLHVLEGELILRAVDGELRLGPGESAVLPEGARLSWRAERPARLIFMRHPDASSGGAACRMDPTLPRTPSNPPLAELLTTPTPSCRNRTQFKSADETFTCGVWDSTPYARRPMTYGHHELMHLLEGEVTFEDEFGARATFSAGDVLLVCRGARCSWDSPVPVTKVFAIHRPV